MELIADDVDFSAYLAEPEAQQKVKPASHWIDSLIERLTCPQHTQGKTLPWVKTFDQFRIRPNEITLWPGTNGHGKSLLVGQVMLGLMEQGEKVLICSMEMKPVSTMERMTKQAIGLSVPTPIEARQFLNWTDNKLWIYDHLGSVHWQKLLGVFRYCAKELGITQIVIDSLMKCGISDDDYQGQKSFMDALCTIKMDYPIHIHLILHGRKLMDESQLPGKFDVKGTGSLTDLADNVATVWRNKSKEEVMKKSAIYRTDKENQTMQGPDCLLVVDKQRHHEWEGKIALWYIPGVGQYTENESQVSTSINFN